MEDGWAACLSTVFPADGGSNGATWRECGKSLLGLYQLSQMPWDSQRKVSLPNGVKRIPSADSNRLTDADC